MSRPVRVLQSMAVPDGATTRFADHVLGSLRHTDVQVAFYSVRKALLGRYEVFHLHWPESLVDHPRTSARWVRRGVLVFLLARWRWRRTAVVRTLHNATPHDDLDPVGRRLLRALDRRTDHVVLLNRSTPWPLPTPTTVVPHSDYVERFEDVAVGEPRVPGRILHVGLVKRYKDVPGLVRAFAALDDPAASLRVVGAVEDDALRREVEALAQDDARVGTRWSFVPDAEMVREVRAASLVVLPYTRLDNSGVLLVALSLGTPVLVPAFDATVELQDEVGSVWVRTFEPPLTADHLAAALAGDRPGPGAAPLRGRDWLTVGRALERVYEATIAARRGATR